MAEAIITDIVAKPIEALASMAFKKIKFAASNDLHSAIDQLGFIYRSINDTLQNVDPFEASSNIERMKIERLQLIHDELNCFFTKLAATTGVQSKVMGSHGFTSEVCSFLSSPSPKRLLLRFIYAEKVNDLTSKLKSLASVNQLCKNLAINPSGNQHWRTPSEDTSPFPVTDVLIGRDTDKENIINLLSKYSIVAIVGVGGQGKTTLAQYVCQDDRVKGSFFDQVLWVHVTLESSVKEILEKIITSATGNKPTICGFQQLSMQVETIVRRRSLLVLDNVSYVDNLRDDSERLNSILKKAHFWGNGGKVLLTTRSKAAAKLMSTPEPYELHDLAKDDCWILLRHYAIEQEQEEKKESGIEEIGREIIEMCPKVPLVLKVIGRHLADKDYKSQWQRFRNELASNPTVYMPKQHEKIKQILKLCYVSISQQLEALCCFLFALPQRSRI